MVAAAVITLIPLHVGKCGNEVTKLPVWVLNRQKWAKSQIIHSLFFLTYVHLNLSITAV